MARNESKAIKGQQANTTTLYEHIRQQNPAGGFPQNKFDPMGKFDMSGMLSRVRPPLVVVPCIASV